MYVGNRIFYTDSAILKLGSTTIFGFRGNLIALGYADHR